MLTPETMKLVGCTKKDVDKDRDGEIIPKLESVEVTLVHCKLVKNDYQHTSNFYLVLSQTNISPHSSTMMNTVNTELSFAEVQVYRSR